MNCSFPRQLQWSQFCPDPEPMGSPGLGAGPHRCSRASGSAIQADDGPVVAWSMAAYRGHPGGMPEPLSMQQTLIQKVGELRC